MGDLLTDIKLVLVIIFFLYTIKWVNNLTGSKVLGAVIAAIIAYLTYYSHFEIMIFVLIFFFGYTFFDQLSSGFEGN